MPQRLLLIDDDKTLHELLDEYLSAFDFELEHALDGPSGLQRLEAHHFDALLVDYMMPGMDGLEVIRRVRAKRDIPIIMLTARGDASDRVVGLELGADDYVTKPFNPRELLARIRALLRRSSRDFDAEIVQVKDVSIDVDARKVTRDGAAVDLTGIEFDILAALARKAGRVVSRESILSDAGRDDVYVGDRTVDVHVFHIRQKLGDEDHLLIKTVRGVGYVMARE